MKDFIKSLLAILVLLLSCAAFMFGYSYSNLQESGFLEYLRHRQHPPVADAPPAVSLQRCAGAPFVLPTGGWVGVLYGDTILGTFNHSGLDIFGANGNGVTPVYATYDGYATRYPNWVSAVVIRHPRDPLRPDRQIWTYYAHMADATGHSYIVDQIPPGTVELKVKQGMLLGYQGDYNGYSWREVSTHLHFSIVLDNGEGLFLNEMERVNTIDPSPYFGMCLRSNCADRSAVCR